MRRLKNSIIQIHNLLGTFLSLMFVVWFLSGFVLIYAGFPHASRKERFLHLDHLTESDFQSIQAPLSSFSGRVELEKMNNKPVYRVYSGRKSQKVYSAVTLEKLKDISKQDAIALAEDFNGGKVSEVEKLVELDQWMPWSYYKPLLPFYKCVMNDEAHTRLYISEKSGSIVQETTRKSRWAARLGAIPHWIYFKSLRLKTGLWLEVVKWISIFGVFVSLSGLIAGFIRLKKRKKKERWTDFSPYKKFWHKWHHITGFVFGLFVFTFILSGLVSVTDIPQWLVARHNKKSVKRIWNQKLDVDQHASINFTDMWKMINTGNPIRKVVFKTVQNQACYWVYRDHFEQPDVYCLSDNGTFNTTHYSKESIVAWCKQVMPDMEFGLSSQDEFDAYYQKSGMWKRPLPIWQINLQDPDCTRLYVSPASGEVVKSYTNNDRWRRWLYRCLHTLDFPFLKKHDWLRKALLVFLSIGGTMVSVSGFALGVKWIIRKRKKMQPIKVLK